MNERHEFDDLARRKLEERQFAFDEAAWSDVERVLAAKRRHRGGWVWWTMSGAALLLIGFLVWRSVPVEPITRVVVPNVGVTAHEENPVPPAQGEEGATATQVHDQVAPTEVDATSTNESTVAGAAMRTTPKQPPHEPQVADHRTNATPQEEGMEHITAAGTTTDHATHLLVVEPGSGTSGAVGDTVTPVEQPSNAGTVGSVAAGILPPVVVAIPAGNEPSGSAISATDRPATTDSTSGTNEDAAKVEPAIEPLVVVPLDGQNDNGEDVPSSTPATADSTVATTSNDPTPPAIATAPPPPAIIPASSPWEVSVLGGYFTTTSTYSGPGSDTWDVSEQQTPGVGGEWMHMG
ncbi:MAG TPA: hypothetical protein VKG92_00830, partial [Flavobacteriales bacterium]|nr:hypothetical protein [Flavobacteriales bacterium]